MSHEPMSGGGVVATRYVVPKVSGDAEAAYRFAVAFQDLAEAISAARHHTAVIIGALAASWRGPGHRALDHPVGVVLHNATLLAATLDDAAAAFETYAKQLEVEHERHKWSMTKVLKVATVVAVSATAIVVTVGAAGAVEAASAAAAVGGASEAAGGAMLADGVAASALEEAFTALPMLQPLLGFVLPNLLQAEWSMGAMATWEEGTIGQLRWRGLAETGAITFVASGAAGAVAKSRPLVESMIWAGAAGVDDEVVDHRFDVADIAESFVLARGSLLGRDVMREKGWWPQPPDYRREALVKLLHSGRPVTDASIAREIALLRQPVGELERGVIDLRMNEGPGHTVDRHIGKSATELLTRVRGGKIPVASTYWDQASARDAIQQTLTANSHDIKAWAAAGYPKTLRLRMTSPYDLGFAIDRAGKVTFVRDAMVVLRRDHAGVVLVTSFPRR